MAKAKECCDELTPSERSAQSLQLAVENAAMSGRILDIDGLSLRSRQQTVMKVRSERRSRVSDPGRHRPLRPVSSTPNER